MRRQAKKQKIPKILKSCFVQIAIISTIFTCSMQKTYADRLVTDLSSDRIEIKSNFTGTEILIFGEIQKSDMSSDLETRNMYDVAVVISGPLHTIQTRRKGRFLGIWMNVASETFVNVPGFYVVHTTQPLKNLGPQDTLKKYEIGLNNITLSTLNRSSNSSNVSDPFQQAFIHLQQKAGLYGERIGSIEFISPTLFKTTVPIPSNVPVGDYKVSTYLIQKGMFLGQTNKKLSIEKSGFEQYTSRLAHNQGLFYGILAIVLAFTTGFLAEMILRKD